MPKFTIDIEAAGVITGPGPIATAQSWRNVRRLSREGEIAFTMPAVDPRAALLAEKNVARCYSIRANARTEFGAGVIDDITLDTSTPGGATIQVAGSDLLSELRNKSVGFLQLDNTNDPFNVTTGIMFYAPAGWTVTGYSTTAAYVTLSFAGESVLEAIVKIADVTGERFRLGPGRTIVWLRNDIVASGVRCARRGDVVGLLSNPDMAVITKLTKQHTSRDLATKIYPFGAGNGDARLTLALTTSAGAPGTGATHDYTFTAAVGSVTHSFTLHIDGTDNRLCYIRDDTAVAVSGTIERHVSFPDVTPKTTGGTDVTNASNQLFDIAVAHLVRVCKPQELYELSVTKLDKAIEPGQTVDVVYSETDETSGYKIVNINATLLVLEVTTEMDNQGVRTAGLVVSNTLKDPLEDVISRKLAQLNALLKHNQPV